MFSLQGPDGPPGKLGFPGEMVRKIGLLYFPLITALEEVLK